MSKQYVRDLKTPVGDEVVETVHCLLFDHLFDERRAEDPRYLEGDNRAENKAKRRKHGAEYLAIKVASHETRYFSGNRRKQHLKCLKENKNNLGVCSEGGQKW